MGRGEIRGSEGHPPCPAGDMYSHDGDTDEPEWVKTEREQFVEFRDKNRDGKMDKEETKDWILPSDYDHAEAEARHLVYESDQNKVGMAPPLFGERGAFWGARTPPEHRLLGFFPPLGDRCSPLCSLRRTGSSPRRRSWRNTTCSWGARPRTSGRPWCGTTSFEGWTEQSRF